MEHLATRSIAPRKLKTSAGRARKARCGNMFSEKTVRVFISEIAYPYTVSLTGLRASSSDALLHDLRKARE